VTGYGACPASTLWFWTWGPNSLSEDSRTQCLSVHATGASPSNNLRRTLHRARTILNQWARSRYLASEVHLSDGIDLRPPASKLFLVTREFGHQHSRLSPSGTPAGQRRREHQVVAPFQLTRRIRQSKAHEAHVVLVLDSEI
jgi:hypothetical protein